MISEVIQRHYRHVLLVEAVTTPQIKGKEHEPYSSMGGMSRNLNSHLESTPKPILIGGPTAEQNKGPTSRKKGKWLLVSQQRASSTVI